MSQSARNADANALRDHLPHYRSALRMHAAAITENATATKGRDQAADVLDDARARATAEAKGDQPREARAAEMHTATLDALTPYRKARDNHTDTAAELERTRVLERGEREILRTLRTLVQLWGGELE